MRDGDLSILGEIFFISLAVGAFAALVANKSTAHHYKTEAIKRGYAEHDRQTGEWRWVEPKEKAE